MSAGGAFSAGNFEDGNDPPAPSGRLTLPSRFSGAPKPSPIQPPPRAPKPPSLLQATYLNPVDNSSLTRPPPPRIPRGQLQQPSALLPPVSGGGSLFPPPGFTYEDRRSPAKKKKKKKKKRSRDLESPKGSQKRKQGTDPPRPEKRRKLEPKEITFKDFEVLSKTNLGKIKVEATRFLKERGFGNFTKAELKSLEARTTELKCSMNQFRSVIRCLGDSAGLHNHQKIVPTLRNTMQRQRAWDSPDFIELSKKIFTPPVNIIRQYLTLKYDLSKSSRGNLIKAIWAGKKFQAVSNTFKSAVVSAMQTRKRKQAKQGFPPPPIPNDAEMLPTLSREMFEAIKRGAIADGFTGPKATKRTQALADEFEDNLANHLSSLGVTFLRENAIREKYGQTSSTPDYLFTGCEVKINGHRCAWLDAKSFIGSEIISGPRVKKLRQQAQKYKARWGPGCYMFSAGYVDTFPRNFAGLNVIICDGSPFRPEPRSPED